MDKQFTQEDLKECYETISHGITIRGEMMSWTMLKGIKEYEFRKRRINKKYLCFHISSTPELNNTILFLTQQLLLRNMNLPQESDFDKIKKGYIVGIIKIGEIKDSNDLPKDTFSIEFSQFCGNKSHYIEKILLFDNPIKSKGLQSVPWNIQSVEKKYKSNILNEIKGEIKKKIGKELKLPENIDTNPIEEDEIIEKNLTTRQRNKEKTRLTKLKVVELRKICKDKNLKCTKLKKVELINLILDNF
jgi:hypothetical protein